MRAPTLAALATLLASCTTPVEDGQRLTATYERAEERLEHAQEAAREARRKGMGLEPRVHVREEELILLAPDVTRRLRALGHGGR